MRNGIMKRFLALTAIICCLLAVAGPARASDFITEPWNLALVVDGSTRLDRPWLRSTPRAALSGALQLELRSLPLRVTAAVWESCRKGARNLVPPTASPKLKGCNLALLPGEGGPDLGPGMKAALAWLGASGGGSLLLISAGGGPIQTLGPDIFAKPGGIYCHALGVGEDQPGLAKLVLDGGGSFRLAPKPTRMGLFLHGAVKDAISPANLLIKAADAENRPLATVYHILRRGVRAKPRPALTGRKVQLAAGSYGLTWPDKKTMGPGEPPSHVKVGLEGTTLLWAGGVAKLLIKPLGLTKSKRPWRVKVSRVRDGKMVSPYRQVPLELSLPTGRYLVGSIAPALNWKLSLAPGQDLTLGIGLPGGLTARLAGPGGPARVPFEATAILEDRKPYTGYTGYRLRLAPGPYRIKVLTTPPLWRKVDISPQKDSVLELPTVGKLTIRDPRGKPMPFVLHDAGGRLLAKGRGGELLFLQPGAYLVKTAGLDQLFKVRVAAGRVTTLQTPGQ